MDFSSAALRAATSGDMWAPALAFAAGAAASIGPCVAPRFVTVAALTTNKTIWESARIAAWFIAGLVAAYVLFAITGSLMWQAFRHSGEIYLAGSALMAAAGLAALMKPSAACTHVQTCRRRPAGNTFLLGTLSAAMVSPCCTPVVLASIGYAGSTGVWFSCAVIACFALGHALPVGLMAIGGGAIRPVLASPSAHGASGMIAGSLMLALAGYYAVIA